MLFNSLPYGLFLPVVFAIYWMLSKGKLSVQNLFLLGASYVFYACWDWRFLFLLMFSTALDYFTGHQIFRNDTNESKRKFWFWLSIGVNLGFLGVFKYYNFFAVSFAAFVENFGFRPSIPLLQIILPVGISFYTFHGLSYVIDIYKRRITPEKNIVDYSLFVSYFPLLVAGPIERATHLLPQIKVKREFSFDKARDGIFQILWGLFKKIVIADNCARYANDIFNNYESYNSTTLILGAVYFAFQIYGDFSGYSDIALGTSKLFGIDLLRNFNYPYFSRDIAEFWRRWHISLSTWFRDYLYIPLGGSKVNLQKRIRNTFVIFLVSGFWHGANWTFIIWGALNALYFMPLLLSNKNRNHMDIVARGSLLPGWRNFLNICLTFALTCFAWIFFRSESLDHAMGYITTLLSLKGFGNQYLGINRYAPELLALLFLFIVIEWLSRAHEHPMSGKFKTAKAVLLIAGIIVLGAFSDVTSFIYFQF